MLSTGAEPKQLTPVLEGYFKDMRDADTFDGDPYNSILKPAALQIRTRGEEFAS
jgi:hypothetical protein